MNGEFGRIRRILAGLVSAMMVLTSLPLTGAAAYAAPSDNAVADMVEKVEQGTTSVEDVAEEAAPDEASVDDAAAQEDTDSCTISFNRAAEDDIITAVVINEQTLVFGDNDSVSINVTKGSADFTVIRDEDDEHHFIYPSSNGLDDFSRSTSEADTFNCNFRCDSVVYLTSHTYETSSIKLADNPDVVLSENEASVVSLNGIHYAKSGQDYEFKPELTAAAVAAGKEIKSVTLQLGSDGQQELTPSEEGFYGIDCRYIIDAAKHNDDITITVVTGKKPDPNIVRLPITVSGNITYINYSEYDPVKEVFVQEYEWKELTNRSAEIEIRKGNTFYLDDIYPYPENYDFIRVWRGDTELDDQNDACFIENIQDGDEIRIGRAQLALSEVAFNVTGNTDTVSLNMSVKSSQCRKGYIKVPEDPKKPYVEIVSNQTLDKDYTWRYGLTDMEYAVTGGAKGDIPNVDGANLLWKDKLKEAAFATPDSNGKKLTITARVVKTVKKPPQLSIISSPPCLTIYSVVQGGPKVDQEEDTGDGIERYSLVKGPAATLYLSVEPGYEIEKYYLVKDSDIRAAGLSTYDPDYRAKLREKLTASHNAIQATVITPDPSGTITIDTKKMDSSYTLFAASNPGEKLVVSYFNGEEILPDEDGIYNSVWYRRAYIDLYRGSDSVPVSVNSISVNNGETTVSEPNVWFSPNMFSIMGENTPGLNGRIINIYFETDEEEPRSYSLKLRLSKLITDESAMRFADGVLSGNEIPEPQTLGASKTYDIEVEKGIDPVIDKTALPTGVSASLDPQKDSTGKTTGYKLTVDSEAVTGLSECAIKINDNSAKYWAAKTYSRELLVHFSSDPVKNAVLGGIKAEADTDTIRVDFSNVTGVDKSIKGLYYKISVSTNSSVSECAPLAKSMESELIPVTADSCTVNLADNNDEVFSKEITYDVKVKLVQAQEGKEDKTIAASDAVSLSANTKAGVYATRITLKKAKSAGTLYGGIKAYTDGIGDIGMDKTLIATVNYPNVGGKTVTVKRARKLELINSQGIPSKDSDKILTEEDGKIYFKSKGVNLEPGKYTVAVYTMQPGGRDVKATMKIKVGMPIIYLQASTPTNILCKKDKKAVSITPKLTYNLGDKRFAPTTKKVTWQLLTPNNQPFVLPAGWSFKNGKVTIGKNVVLPKGGVSFRIMAYPADFEHGNDGVKAYTGLITVKSIQEAQAPASLCITGYKVKPGDVYSLDLSGDISVRDAEGRLIDNFTVKTTGALKVGASSKPGVRYRLYPVRMGTGTVKVTTADGSGLSKTFKYNIIPDKGFKLVMLMGAESDSSYHSYGSDPNGSISNNYSMGQGDLFLSLYGEEYSATDHKLVLSGLKKIKTNAYGLMSMETVVLRPTARNASIEITDNQTKETTFIRVTNNGFPESPRAATAKITASNKIFTTYGKKAVDKKGVIYTDINYGSKAAYDRVSSNYVTYTVKYGKTAAKEGDRVRIALEESTAATDSDVNKIKAALEASGAVKDRDGSYIMTLGAGGRFSINYITADGSWDVTDDTYRFFVTPIDDKGAARYRTGSVKLKMVFAPKAKVTAKTKLVFSNTAVGASVNLIPLKQVNVAICDGGKVSSLVFGGEGRDLDIRGTNVGGRINGFAKMFKVEDGKLVYTGEKDLAYSRKKGISGTVAVSYTALDGSRQTTYVPITVRGNF